MITAVDADLRLEAASYELRFRCEHCAHFEPESGRCAEGFPNGMHRDVSLERVTTLTFCKSFELG